jgi:carbon-monoxide dehydrogenase medium subunit
MYPLSYERPASVEDAVRLFATADEAMYLAGGQSLLPMMKSRLAAPATLIDLRHLAALSGTSVSGDRLVIGAATCHAAVADDPTVRACIPALAELAGSIADMHVRNLGTIGGSLSLNDPAADYPAAVLALDGEIVTDRRTISAAGFFMGIMTTALEVGELITAVSFRIPTAAAYRKVRNPASGFPMAGSMFARFTDGCRVGVTGVGANGAFRWSEAEELANSGDNLSTLEQLLPEDIDVLSDLQAGPDYRLHLMRLMVFRAISAAS